MKSRYQNGTNQKEKKDKALPTNSDCHFHQWKRSKGSRVASKKPLKKMRAKLVSIIFCAVEFLCKNYSLFCYFHYRDFSRCRIIYKMKFQKKTIIKKKKINYINGNGFLLKIYKSILEQYWLIDMNLLILKS